METSININKQQHAMDILEKLNSFRKEKKYCDFVIKAGSREIAVHRYVVAGASDYFDAMLSHETLENESGVATVKDIDSDCVEKGIEYIYTGDLSVGEENYQPMMHLAHMWQLQKLCDGIAENLGCNLDLSSFFYTRKLAKLYNCKNLDTVCNDFALKNFSEISQLDDFGNLERPDMEFLVAKYSQGDHTVKLQAVLKWIKHDLSDRKECLLGFMNNIDLTKIPLEYRRFIVENESLINSTEEVMKMWMKSVFQTFNVRSSDPGKLMKKSSQEIVIFDDFSQRFQSFNMIERSWRPILLLDQDVTNGNFTTAVSGQHLFVFSSIGKKNFRIPYSEPNQWERLPNRNIGERVRAISLNGIIYISDYEQRSNNIESYIIDTNTWNMIACRRMSVMSETLATCNGSFFTIGGWNGRSVVTDVERFDPAIHSWTNDGNLNVARTRSSAATVGETIFVLGGWNSKNLISDVEFRCPETRSWTRVTSMQVSRKDFNAVCINQKIYAVGGDFRGHTFTNPPTIEEYDPEKKQWKEIVSMIELNINRFASIAVPV